MSEQALPQPAGDAPLRGIVFLVSGMSLFAVQDVIIRLLSDSYAAVEIVFVRSLVAILPALAIAYFENGRLLLRSRRPYLNILRGITSFVSYTAYYLALAKLTLADTVTLYYSCPLFVTALAGPLLAEKVGLRRWLAVLAGFAGVAVMMQPGSSTLEPAAALAIFAALCYALSILMTRRIGQGDAGATMALYVNATYLVCSLGVGLAIGDGRFDTEGHASLQFLFRAWHIPDWYGFGLMAICGLIAAIGFYCLSQAYRLGPVSVVAPFEYCTLPWAILWGFVFWQEIPGWSTGVGIVLIVGSGLYIVHRESLRGRPMVSGRTLRPKV